MCRLYALLANEPTKLECRLVESQKALIQQCRGADVDGRHADGWGVVCYGVERGLKIPEIVRQHNADSQGMQFSQALENVYSQAVVAHVRHATVGYPSGLNAHPFTHGEWTFAHNGTVPAFERLTAKLEAGIGERYLNCRLGTTDSELFFLWLLYQLAVNGIHGDNIADESRQAQEVIARAVSALAELCAEEVPDKRPSLNFVLTNGTVLLACRWNNPMYSTVRTGVYDCEVCGIPHIRHDSGMEHRAVVVASEPITKESWKEIPNHSLLYVAPDLVASVQPITSEMTTKAIP